MKESFKLLALMACIFFVCYGAFWFFPASSSTPEQRDVALQKEYDEANRQAGRAILLDDIELARKERQERKGLRSLEELMPQLAIRQTTTGYWHVWSKAYDATDWVEDHTDLPTADDAMAVIEDVRAILKLKYDTAKMISDAF